MVTPPSNKQMNLWDKPKTTIQERFEIFHRQHPEVYELFRKLACRVRRAGWRHYSADAILHRIRWEHDVNPDRDGGFKINSVFSSRYARVLALEEGFEDFFEFRVLRTE